MSLCRLCLTSGAGSRIFDNSGGDVAARIKTCCRLKVQKDDGLPDCICFECFILLEKLSHFIKVSKESDKILRKNKKLNPIVEMNIEKSDNEENTNGYNCDVKPIEQVIESPIEWKREENASPPPINPLTDIKKEPESEVIPENLIKKEVSDSDDDPFEEKCEEPCRESVSQNLIPMKDEVIQKSSCIAFKMKDQKPIGSSLCPICAKEFKRPCALNQHIKTHNRTKKYFCSICNKGFGTKYHMKVHENTHSKIKNFPCNICGKMFLTLEYVVKHVRKTHKKEKLTNCHICNKTYDESYLKRHMMIHNAQPDYICDICNRPFSTKSAITSHMRSHTGEKPYTCKFCAGKFSYLKTVIEHERLHTGETPYKCPVCNKGYAQKSNMKSHFRNNHKDVDPQLIVIGRIRKKYAKVL